MLAVRCCLFLSVSFRPAAVLMQPAAQPTTAARVAIGGEVGVKMVPCFCLVRYLA